MRTKEKEFLFHTPNAPDILGSYSTSTSATNINVLPISDNNLVLILVFIESDLAFLCIYLTPYTP